MIILSSYLIKIALSSDYPQIAGLILGSLFGLFGIVSVLSIYFIDSLQIDKEKLIVKTLFGNTKKTIKISEILSFTEIEKENGQGKWKDLTIYTKNNKLKLSSSMIKNYVDFRKILIKGKKRDLEIEKLWSIKVNRRFGIGFVIFGVLFLSVMVKIYLNRNAEISNDQIKTISSQLVEQLKIERTSPKSVSKVIKLKLKDYENFTFELGGHSYSATNTNRLLNDVKIGDNIELDIKLETFEKKIAKTKSLTFSDKSVNYHFIPVYGLRKGNSTYLKLGDYNIKHKEDSSSLGFWILVFVGLGIMISGIYMLIVNKKPAANNV